MNRVFTWKSVAVGVGLVLAAALACFISGNTGMASALTVVAVVEGTMHTALVGLISLGSKLRTSRAG